MVHAQSAGSDPTSSLVANYQLWVKQVPEGPAFYSVELRLFPIINKMNNPFLATYLTLLIPMYIHLSIGTTPLSDRSSGMGIILSDDFAGSSGDSH